MEQLKGEMAEQKRYIEGLNRLVSEKDDTLKERAYGEAQVKAINLQYLNEIKDLQEKLENAMAMRSSLSIENNRIKMEGEQMKTQIADGQVEVDRLTQ